MVSFKDFLKNKIKDNSNFVISKYIDLNNDKFGKGRKKKSETLEQRKKTILKTLSSLFTLINKISPKEIIFADEYENTTFKIFELEGLEYEKLKLYTGNIVGSIRYDEFELNIHSRFGDKFLMYMIANADGFLEYENMGSIDKNASLGEWLLIYLWKIKLKKASSLGMYKSYENFKDDLLFVKGKIDFSKNKFQINRKITCEYREHSYSNEINYKIKLALNKTFKRYPELVKDIAYLKRGFDEIKYRKNSKNKILNPYYYPYKEVYDLSLKILKNEFASIGEEKFNAILFDISMLFEHHIRKLLIKNRFILDEKNKKEFTIPNGVGESKIYPDIIIKHPDGSISIFDVKYKNFDKVYGVNREDRFQLISYIAIYSQAYKIKECGFIYPTTSNETKDKIQELKFCNKEIPFKVLFYKISNDTDNFRTFQQKLDNEFIKKFKSATIEQ